MKCSVCSEKIVPVVAVDIDGTLGDYYTLYTQFAERYIGKHMINDYDGVGEFSDALRIDKSLDREVKLALRQSGMKRDMRPYPGATTFMQRLRDMGLEIWIATTRPWLRLDNIDPDTREWLDRNRMPYDYMIYGHDKYEILLDRVHHYRIICVVDDLLEQCERAATEIANPDKVWQVARSHNRNAQWMNRAPNFEKLLVWVDHEREMWHAYDAAVSRRSQSLEGGH